MTKVKQDLDYIFDYLCTFNSVDTLELLFLLSETYVKNNEVNNAYKVLMEGVSKAISLNESVVFFINDIDRRLVDLLEETNTQRIIAAWEKRVLIENERKRGSNKYYKIKCFGKNVKTKNREQRYYLINKQKIFRQLSRIMPEGSCLESGRTQLINKVHDAVDVGDWKYFLENHKVLTLDSFPESMISWRILVENLYRNNCVDTARNVTKLYIESFFIKLAPTGYSSFGHYINSFVESILVYESWEYVITILKGYGELFPWSHFGPIPSDRDIKKMYQKIQNRHNRFLALEFLSSFRYWPSEYDNILDELSMYAFKDEKYSLSLYFCMKSSSPQSAMWSIISTLLINYDVKKDYSKIFLFLKERESCFKADAWGRH